MTDAQDDYEPTPDEIAYMEEHHPTALLTVAPGNPLTMIDTAAVPPRAIAASMKVTLERFPGDHEDLVHDDVVAILQAAAPHMAATGVLHAIGRLDRLAAAHHGTAWAGAYEAAAAALREELKIAEENAA